jgi:hypothetical protein
MAYRRPQGKVTYLQDSLESPFPLNPQFKSKPILTDKARELIWKKIIIQGETIKAVSAEFGVDINRVAAVVRLKEVEKDWLAKVRYELFVHDLPSCMMIASNQIRLVFKTHTWLQNLLRASLIYIEHINLCIMGILDKRLLTLVQSGQTFSDSIRPSCSVHGSLQEHERR